MRKLVPVVLAFLGVAFAAFAYGPPDQPALPDGGSLVTSNGNLPGDGGGPEVTVDTGQTDDWIATLKCSSLLGSPGVHYRFSTDRSTATTNYNVIDVDRTMDIPVRQGNTDKYRYLSLRGEDGGPPSCRLFKNDLR